MTTTALFAKDVLLWWSKKVAQTTRTFGERGARAHCGKVPHDDVVFLTSLCLFFVTNGKDENACAPKTRLLSMLSSVDVKKALRRRRRRRSLSLSLSLLLATRDL